MKTIEQKLISDINAFRKKSGLSRYSFGISAANDPKLLSRIESGKSILSTTINKIYEFMETYQLDKDIANPKN